MSTDIRTFRAPIVRLFACALGRDPTPAELAGASGRLRDGACLQDIAEELMQSQEFRARQTPGEASLDALLARWTRAATPADRLVAWSESSAMRQSVALLPGILPHASPDDPAAYRLWLAEYDTVPQAPLAALPALPAGRVTLAMLVGDTTAEPALASIASLRAQLHADWSLRILANRLISPWARGALAALRAADARITQIDAPDALGRAEALNLALAAPDGAFVAVLDPGDRLPSTALYEVAAAFAARPDCRLVYTDEDVWDGEGRRLPRFKPGYSPDAAAALDLMGQLAVYRADLLAEIGGLRPAAAPDEDHDLRVRAAARAGAAGIFHLPAILCHRAAALPPPVPRPGAAAGLAVAPGSWPPVSVIIPTRDHADLLATCLAGVLERTDYPALDVIVVDNGSVEPGALSVLGGLSERPRVRVLHRPGGFNFAALNNAAAAIATGEVLLLLNDDIEVLRPDWLTVLVGHALRPDVGAVGARLLYPDGTLQHAGILLGPEGAATHVGRHAPADAPGYLGQFACTRDLSAVTGACLAIRRDVWRAVGGMDERLAVTWNDVDLCLRVRAAGLRVIWTPEACLLHREGSSRGSDADSEAARRRFLAEQALMRQIWGERLTDERFLNPNLLALEGGTLALTRPRHARPWHGLARADHRGRTIMPSDTDACVPACG